MLLALLLGALGMIALAVLRVEHSVRLTAVIARLALAGLLVRALDPDPATTHPLYPVKLEAVGYGLLVPVFFVTSGLTVDLSGLIAHPAALATVPAFLLALLVVRALPAVAYHRELERRELIAVGLLQVISLLPRRVPVPA